MKAEKVAKWLGWFSLALGLLEALAPRRVNTMVGVKGNETLTRAYGLREIAAGAGLLLQPRPTWWMWSRVAGDVLDLATLGTAARNRKTKKVRLGSALGMVVAITVLDVLCARALSKD